MGGLEPDYSFFGGLDLLNLTSNEHILHSLAQEARADFDSGTFLHYLMFGIWYCCVMTLLV